MIADLLTGFGIVVALAAAVVLGWPIMRGGWRGISARLSLQFDADGRYAVRLADSLQASCRRIRKVLSATEPDAAEREPVLTMLAQFTGPELTALLTQMRLILATGDNRRIRELHRRIEAETQTWSGLNDSPERERLATTIAGLKHDLDARSQTGRAWVALVHGLEQTARDLEALERELVVSGVARQQPISAFRGRIAESLDRLRHVRAAHAELDAGR